MKKSNNIALGIIVLVAIALGSWYYLFSGNMGPDSSGVVWENASDNLITLDILKPGNVVLPKFTVTGEARGYWYFEASFPVEVLDAEGKQLDIEPATAIGDWMTEEFVPFRVELDLGSYSGPATIIFRKDNPSGLPENDGSLSVPIEVLVTN